MTDSTPNINKKNITWIIIFSIFSILWLGLCLLSLLPCFQSLLLRYGEYLTNLIGKNHPAETLKSFLDVCIFAGFTFYFFVIFLVVLEKFIIKQQDLKNIHWERLFLISITLLAVLIRITGFNFKSVDYIGFLTEWVKHFRENGLFTGFKTFSGNYNAIYLYYLKIVSFLPLSMELYLIKIFSCAFDFICAFYSLKIIFHLTNNKKTSLLIYAVVLFSPTVFLNSGVWAQCDSIHTAFVLISFYYLLKNNIRLSMIFFGIGLSFKLQAIFPLPFILLFFVYKKISLKYLLYIPIGIVGISIPAWLLGWPLAKIFINYLVGSGMYENLTWNAPTIFAWGNIPSLMPVIFITAVLFCLGFLVINKKSVPSNNTLLLLFLFCNFVIPFFLPNMHERYFYMGEIAVLLYSVINPKRFWISFIVIMPALPTYSGFLWNFNPFSLINLALIVLLAVIIISKWLIESILLDQRLSNG
jgi:Gpi18-like mannosyltransferase